MKLINAKTASSNISEIIKFYSNEKIKVHSIFNKIINIQLGKRLICIGYSEVNISPFGVVINEEDFKYLVKHINKDAAITLEEDKFIFNGKLIVSTKTCLDPRNPNFNVEKLQKDKLIRNIKFLKSLVLISNWNCGFEWTFSSIMKSIKGEEIEGMKEFNKCLSCILNVKYINEKSSKEFLDYFIGRGKGLTPSGDDLIIGMLGVYNFSGVNIEGFKSVLKTYIDITLSKTTGISNEYLFYSLKNEFSTSLVDLIISLLYEDEKKILKNVMNVKKVGSTSPIDTIIGIIIAVYSLMED